MRRFDRRDSMWLALVGGVLCLGLPAAALACMGALVLPEATTRAQLYAYDAGQILGRARACGVDLSVLRSKAPREITRLSQDRHDKSCALYALGSWQSKLADYQSRHNLPRCSQLVALLKDAEGSPLALPQANRAIKRLTAKALRARQTTDAPIYLRSTVTTKAQKTRKR